MSKEKNSEKLHLKITENEIDPIALTILKRLKNFEFEVFLVGGCIRDLILGKKVNDWDIVTQASVNEIINCFSDFKLVTFGKKHGTILLIKKHLQYQVSTFKSMTGFNPNLQNDLKRRDFTINSLAWSEKSGLIDLYHGIDDIRIGTIRFTEIATDRIKEDPLRMLRAIRLACELDFKIEKDALDGIHGHCELLQKVSIERVRDEFIKIIISDSSMRGLKLLNQTNLLKFIMPELQAYLDIQENDFSKGQKIQNIPIEFLNNLPSNFALRLSMIMHIPSRKLNAKEKILFINKVLKRIRIKNKIIKKVNILLKEKWNIDYFSQKKSIRYLAHRIGMENLKDYWILCRTYSLFTQMRDKLVENKIRTGEFNLEETIKESPPVTLKDLAVNGEDLIKHGYREGKEIKDILDRLLKLVLEKPELNSKAKLSEYM